VIDGIAAQEVPDALVRVVVRVVERELLLPAALAVVGGGAIERLADARELLSLEHALDEAEAELLARARSRVGGGNGGEGLSFTRATALPPRDVVVVRDHDHVRVFGVADHRRRDRVRDLA
jgi:hypothetical protein